MTAIGSASSNRLPNGLRDMHTQIQRLYKSPMHKYSNSSWAKFYGSLLCEHTLLVWTTLWMHVSVWVFAWECAFCSITQKLSNLFVATNKLRRPLYYRICFCLSFGFSFSFCSTVTGDLLSPTMRIISYWALRIDIVIVWVYATGTRVWKQKAYTNSFLLLLILFDIFSWNIFGFIQECMRNLQNFTYFILTTLSWLRLRLSLTLKLNPHPNVATERITENKLWGV